MRQHRVILCLQTDAFGSDGFALTISFTYSVVTPDELVTVTLTAMNLGDSVVWGSGSSSCQLEAFVRIGIDDRRLTGQRLCTDDMATQGLGPGESLMEHWQWGGEVLIGDRVDTLPEGTYQIVAAAGSAGRSEPRTIRVGPRANQ